MLDRFVPHDIVLRRCLVFFCSLSLLHLHCVEINTGTAISTLLLVVTLITPIVRTSNRASAELGNRCSPLLAYGDSHKLLGTISMSVAVCGILQIPCAVEMGARASKVGFDSMATWDKTAVEFNSHIERYEHLVTRPHSQSMILNVVQRRLR